MKDLVEYIIKNIVSQKDAVVINETQSDDVVDLKISVAPEDMGIVIGKNGQTIKAIRKLLGVRAMAEQTKVNLYITEPGPKPS